MPAMIEKKCKTCKATFSARLADHNRGWAKFCSKSCKAIKQTRTKGRKRFPRHDGRSVMTHKNCQCCGAPAVNGVYSPFGEDNGIEWLCARHMDTTHPFDGDNFNYT